MRHQGLDAKGVKPNLLSLQPGCYSISTCGIMIYKKITYMVIR